jgi:hypothetical protein
MSLASLSRESRDKLLLKVSDILVAAPSVADFTMNVEPWGKPSRRPAMPWSGEAKEDDSGAAAGLHEPFVWLEIMPKPSFHEPLQRIFAKQAYASSFDAMIILGLEGLARNVEAMLPVRVVMLARGTIDARLQYTPFHIPSRGDAVFNSELFFRSEAFLRDKLFAMYRGLHRVPLVVFAGPALRRATPASRAGGKHNPQLELLEKQRLDWLYCAPGSAMTIASHDAVPCELLLVPRRPVGPCLIQNSQRAMDAGLTLCSSHSGFALERVYGIGEAAYKTVEDLEESCRIASDDMHG